MNNTNKKTKTYTEKYEELIAYRKANPPPPDCYCEVHHIQPLSLWGSDEPENRVRLTAKEHLLAHYYLLKSALEKGWPMTLAKMLPAFQLMAHKAGMIPELTETELEAIGTEYQKAKELKSFMMKDRLVTDETRRKLSEANKGKHLTEEAKRKMSLAKRGKTLTEEHKQHLSKVRKGKKNPMYGKRGNLSPILGRKHTEEELKKMSEAQKGKHHTEEAKRKMSEARSGEKSANWGKHWWNNGERNVRAKECPIGFVAGRLKRKQNE